MSSVQRLLSAFIEEHRAGGDADPSAYLERVPYRERLALAALIDAYLARAPRRAFDEARARETGAQASADSLTRAISGTSGLWPVLLPRLRARAALKRHDLVERLAQSLGVGAQTAKVERYYHQMEQGQLPAPGVSDSVLEVLAGLLGSSARALRQAGQALAGAAAPELRAGQAFARATRLDAIADQGPPAASASAEEAWDEVDELFRGGA